MVHLIQKGSLVEAYSHEYEQKYPANIYLFKVNNRNTRKRSKICSKLTIKTVASFYMVSIVNLEQIYCSGVFIVDIEQFNADMGWS